MRTRQLPGFQTPSAFAISLEALAVPKAGSLLAAHFAVQQWCSQLDALSVEAAPSFGEAPCYPWCLVPRSAACSTAPHLPQACSNSRVSATSASHLWSRSSWRSSRLAVVVQLLALEAKLSSRTSFSGSTALQLGLTAAQQSCSSGCWPGFCSSCQCLRRQAYVLITPFYCQVSSQISFCWSSAPSCCAERHHAAVPGA